jgi:hypothetical protein
VRDQGGKIARQSYERSTEAAKSAYGYVMNHPKSTTAVVLGTAVAATLLLALLAGSYPAVMLSALPALSRMPTYTCAAARACSR